jgi:hypothetical protein
MRSNYQGKSNEAWLSCFWEKLFGQSLRVMWIKRISAEFVQTLLQEAQQPQNKDMFQVHILDPIIQYALGRLFPYILVTSIVFLLTFILAIAILILIMHKWQRAQHNSESRRRASPFHNCHLSGGGATASGFARAAARRSTAAPHSS